MNDDQELDSLQDDDWGLNAFVVAIIDPSTPNQWLTAASADLKTAMQSVGRMLEDRGLIAHEYLTFTDRDVYVAFLRELNAQADQERDE